MPLPPACEVQQKVMFFTCLSVLKGGGCLWSLVPGPFLGVSPSVWSLVPSRGTQVRLVVQGVDGYSVRPAWRGYRAPSQVCNQEGMGRVPMDRTWLPSRQDRVPPSRHNMPWVVDLLRSRRRTFFFTVRIFHDKQFCQI